MVAVFSTIATGAEATWEAVMGNFIYGRKEIWQEIDWVVGPGVGRMYFGSILMTLSDESQSTWVGFHQRGVSLPSNQPIPSEIPDVNGTHHRRNLFSGVRHTYFYISKEKCPFK